MPKIINSTFNTAMDRFPVRHREFLRVKFADPLLQNFFDMQAFEAKQQMAEIDPSKIPSEKAVEYLQTAKDARLIWQFWEELAAFVKNWAVEVPTNES